MSLLTIVTLLSSLSSPTVFPSFQSEGVKIQVEQILKRDDVLWGFDFLDENSMVLTEKSGNVLLLSVKDKSLTNLGKVPDVEVHGQGGLLDVVCDPDYPNKPWLYFSFAVKNGRDSWTTRIAKARLKEKALAEWKTIFTAEIQSDETVHFGSRLVFDRKKNLFFSVGDRGQRDKAQDSRAANGKIFILRAGKSQPEIFSLGHRNPQGLAIHPFDGTLWDNEHGPRGGDEINLIRRGSNYGWPVVTFGREYFGPSIGEGTSKKGMEDPVYQFTTSIATSGLMIYSGKHFKAWKGDVFSGSLAFQHLNRLTKDKSGQWKESRYLEGLNERIRDVGESPTGIVFVTTDSGRLLRLSL